MALKRATLTLTTVGGLAVPSPYGLASNSARVMTPTSPVRPVFLDSVAIDDTAALGPVLDLAIYEGIPDTSTPAVVTEGQLLFHMDDPKATLDPAVTGVGAVAVASPGIPSGGYDASGDSTHGGLQFIYPRTTTNVVDETGVAISSAPVRIPIRSTYMVATILGGAQGDVYTLYVYYETAGDWRF